MNEEKKVPTIQRSSPKSAAAEIMEAAIARDEAKSDLAKEEAAKYVWAYACDRKRDHVGLIFTVNPNDQDIFGPGDWYARYHDNNEPFDFELADVICQQCFVTTGEKTPLRVSSAPSPSRGAGTHFRISLSWRERFVHRIERAKLLEWMKLKKTPKEKADA